MDTITKELSHAEQNAQGWYAEIVAQLAALECDFDRLTELRDEREDLADTLTEASAADERNPGPDLIEAQRALDAWDDDNGEELAELTEAAGEYASHDDARERIQEGPLSVEVRSGWNTIGEDLAPEEFRVLLTTGGPALQIRGELDDNREPSRAWLEHQDWGTPWTQWHGASQETLLAYCHQFYFGE